MVHGGPRLRRAHEQSACMPHMRAKVLLIRVSRQLLAAALFVGQLGWAPEPRFSMPLENESSM